MGLVTPPPIPLFSSTARGAVPPSGGDAALFLAGNGTWVVPPVGALVGYESVLSHGAQADDSATPSTALCDKNVTAIVEAYTAAAANGKTVYWPPGRYPVRKVSGQSYAVQLSNINNVNTVGYGATLSQAGDNGAAGNDNRALQIVNCSHLRFEGLTFSQRDVTNYGSQTHATHLGIATITSVVDEIEFVNCTWTESHTGSGDGVRMLGSLTSSIQHVRFLGCRFIGCARSGITVQRGAARVTILHCYFKNMLGGSAIDFEPTAAPSVEFFNIQHNIFEANTTDTAVSLSGTTTDQERSVFAYNRMINATVGGVFLADTDIVGNIIYLDAATVTNPGIYLHSRVTGCRISKNYVYMGPNCGAASFCIQVEGANGQFPDEVEVEGNNCHQYTDTGLISLQSLSNALVIGNRLKYHGATGNRVGIHLSSPNQKASGVIAFNRIASLKQIDGVTDAPVIVDAIHMDKTGAVQFGTLVIQGNRTSRCTNLLFNNAALAEFVDGPPVISGNVGDFTALATGGITTYITSGSHQALAHYHVASSPEGVLAAVQGSTATWRNGDSTRTYRKRTGTTNTGWRIVPDGQEVVASGACTPNLQTTYITTDAAKAYTLADGDATLDGMVKRFVITSGTNAPAGTLTPVHLADGTTHTITWTGPGSFELMWDHANTTWRVIGTPRGATVN